MDEIDAIEFDHPHVSIDTTTEAEREAGMDSCVLIDERNPYTRCVDFEVTHIEYSFDAEADVIEINGVADSGVLTVTIWPSDGQYEITETEDVHPPSDFVTPSSVGAGNSFETVQADSVSTDRVVHEESNAEPEYYHEFDPYDGRDVVWDSDADTMEFGTDEIELSPPDEWDITLLNQDESGDGAQLCCSECGEPVGCVDNGSNFTCGCDDEPSRWTAPDEDDIDRSEDETSDTADRTSRPDELDDPSDEVDYEPI
jgi:hypothetical protein